MLLQSGCLGVSATGGKRCWCASVWHWPREVAQTVAAGFDHDQTLQGGRVGAGLAAHLYGQCVRCHIHTENLSEQDEPSGTFHWGGNVTPLTPVLVSPLWEEVLPAGARRLQPASGRLITHSTCRPSAR